MKAIYHDTNDIEVRMSVDDFILLKYAVNSTAERAARLHELAELRQIGQQLEDCGKTIDLHPGNKRGRGEIKGDGAAL